MTTWSFKALLLSGLGLTLTACDGAGYMGQATTTTKLAGGAVTLAAPRGYCIDPRRVQAGADGSLAVVARCDRLGQNSPGSHAEALAFVMVTTMPLPKGTGPMKARTLAATVSDGTVDTRRDRPDIALIRVERDSSTAPYDPHYWRGAFRVNGQLVGATLYAPTGSSAAGRDGADVLENLARATRAATKASQPEG